MMNKNKTKECGVCGETITKDPQVRDGWIGHGLYLAGRDGHRHNPKLQTQLATD